MKPQGYGWKKQNGETKQDSLQIVELPGGASVEVSIKFCSCCPSLATRIPSLSSVHDQV
jgi:hypothetical protein